MIDQLINLVRNHAGESVINNPAVPNEQNDEILRDVSNNISEGLKEETDKGNIDAIMDMFEHNSETSLMNNSAIDGIMNKVVSSLSSKFGLSPEIADQIATNLLPRVMSQFIDKAKDPNDNDFSLLDIANKFGGTELLTKLSGRSGIL